MFTRMLQQARRTPEQFTELAAELFRVMPAGGGGGVRGVNEPAADLHKSKLSGVLALADGPLDTPLIPSFSGWVGCFFSA